MPKSCVAYNCTNRFVKGNGISFHKFPFSNRERLNKWVSSLHRKNFVPTMHSFICSKHFTPDCFYENHLSRKILKENAVPTIFDFPEHLKKVVASRKPPTQHTLELSHEVGISEENHFSNQTSDHSYFISESPRKLKRKYENVIDKKNEEIEELKKRIKVCNLRVSRKAKKINNLINVIEDLKEKNLVNCETAELLEQNFSELSLQVLKKKTKSFGNELKCFGLSLFFYSPKAYEYCRQTLMPSLPHPTTIRRWYNVINGCPGFTEEALSAIKERVDKINYEVYVALIFDEMSIRKHVDWDGKEFFGYATFGKNICNSQLIEAKEALVFFIVGINVPWSIPIAYFLIDSINADEKANLIRQAIHILNDVNVNVISITFDGISTNFSAAELLGAKLQNALSIKPYFANPADPSKNVYVIPDACHMLKLMRNVFAERLLMAENGNLIQWKYIQDLNSLQNAEGLHLGNKLKSSHLNFYSNKMKVSLAAQVFSRSVAEALEYVNNFLKFPQFRGCESTVEFLLKINNLFDVCNSKNPLSKGSKAALKISNQTFWEPLLEDCENYLLKLKDLKTGKYLYETQRKTPVIGFLCLSKSLKGIFEDLVLSDKLKYIATYKMSQDHLEMFFSRVRQRGGWNNNPSAVQFRAVYKQLLVHNDIKSSKYASVTSQDNTKLLPCLTVLPSVTETVFKNITAERLYNFVDDDENFDSADDEFFDSYSQLSEYTNSIVVYMAGYIVRKLVKKIKCPDCSEALYLENESLRNDTFLQHKDKGGLIKPSLDVVTVCSFVEKCIRQELNMNQGKLPIGNIKAKLSLKVLKFSLGKSFFETLSVHVLESSFPENHIVSLIKAIVNEFLNIRFHHLTKIANIKLKDRNIRQKCTKLVLFKNQ